MNEKQLIDALDDLTRLIHTKLYKPEFVLFPPRTTQTALEDLQTAIRVLIQAE